MQIVVGPVKQAAQSRCVLWRASQNTCWRWGSEQRASSHSSMWFYFSSVWAQWWIFLSILNSIGVRQHISGPTHCPNHTLNLILSHGIDVNGVEVLQQSDDISDHYLVFCKLHIAKAVNSTPCYKYGRTITSTTKDCFVNNLSYSSQFLSTSNSAEKLDDLTETMDSLLSSTLDTISPLCLRKIKENSLIPWYNEHTRTLKRAARKMESSWRKTKLEVFCIAWRESTLSYRKALKTARSD